LLLKKCQKEALPPHSKRVITADTALRLGRYFGTTPEFWMNLQSIYELDKARREKLA
jgi:addiction module HigA family antidote